MSVVRKEIDEGSYNIWRDGRGPKFKGVFDLTSNYLTHLDAMPEHPTFLRRWCNAIALSMIQGLLEGTMMQLLCPYSCWGIAPDTRPIRDLDAMEVGSLSEFQDEMVQIAASQRRDDQEDEHEGDKGRSCREEEAIKLRPNKGVVVEKSWEFGVCR
ncbi:hypothetical protein MLD38_032671 [Melastoma candidum]|uniref:Uncharacterized protein n=1 Tax=Melastoma candidum TaxID=119954 RepID=A0ACB9M807_9MYRT|nr:hypothetical protein MLD38_032671 [Melastoma candidum]